MKKLKGHRATVAGLAVAAVILGGVGIASASGDSTTSAAGQERDEGEGHSYTGSIPAPPESNGSEESEDAALAGLATITPAQAEAAAGAAVEGTVGTAELGNENGYVVYEVAVTAADGSVVEVKVDAGTGEILAREADDDVEGEDPGNEHDDGTESGEDDADEDGDG